jgi:antitoxin ParD1/3/4
MSSIQLTPQLEEIIREKVASGRYHDATEVLSEALIALDDSERLAELQAAVAVGAEQLERGEGQVYTPELRDQIRQRALTMAEEGRKPKPDVCP